MIEDFVIPEPPKKEAAVTVHAYRADGTYAGVYVATPTQLKDAGLTAGKPPATAETTATSLSPWQFEWLLAYTGLDEVWAALEQYLQTTDREAYAQLRAERKARQFEIDATLATVAKFRVFAAKVAPGADLSDTAIKAAWEQAAQYGKI